MAQDKPIKLTAKEQKFVDLVAAGMNKAEAARKAGYSQKNAGVMASEMLRKLNISLALDERRAYFRSISVVEAKDIIGAHTEIAFASIEDVLDDQGRLDFAKAKENGSARLIKKISRQQTKYGETVAIELYSRTDSLAQLADILGIKQKPRENEDTLSQWNSAVKRLIDHGSAANESEAIQLLEHAGFQSPSDISIETVQ